MTDSKDSKMIGTRCPPELVDEFDNWAEANDYSGRSEALREMIKEHMAEHRSSMLKVREVFQYEPLRALAGSLTVVIGAAGTLAGVGLLLLATYGFATGQPEAGVPLVLGFGSLGLFLTIIWTVGALIWNNAAAKAAKQVRYRDRLEDTHTPTDPDTEEVAG